MKKSFIVLALILLGCNSNQKKGNIISNGIQASLKERIVSQARFQNSLIYLDYITQEKDTLTFFTDTGGGKIIYPGIAEKLGLTVDSVSENGETFETVNIAAAFEKEGIPAPVGSHFVYRGERDLDNFNAGFLGGIWFDEKIWKFDYPNKELYVLDEIAWEQLDKKNTTSIAFLKNSNGSHSTHFPRIEIIVENDTLQMLYDSGATANLSEEAQNNFNGKKEIATSFIMAKFFDKWRAAHPDWEFIEDGDVLLKEDLLKVPEVTIAGHTVGPVWMARRADTNFTKFMSQWMDAPIQGAIGGSCFQHFSLIIVDYKSEKAFFEK